MLLLSEWRGKRARKDSTSGKKDNEKKIIFSMSLREIEKKIPN